MKKIIFNLINYNLNNKIWNDSLIFRAADSELSRNLLLSLKTQYLKGKNNILVSLAKFFENPDSLSTEDTYKMPSKTIITKNAKALHQRLFPDNTETSALTTSTGEPVEVVTSVPSMAKQLSDFLKQQSSETR